MKDNFLKKFPIYGIFESPRHHISIMRAESVISANIAALKVINDLKYFKAIVKYFL